MSMVQQFSRGGSLCLVIPMLLGSACSSGGCSGGGPGASASSASGASGASASRSGQRDDSPRLPGATGSATPPATPPTTPPPDEDGYALWLRYPRVGDRARLEEYRAAASALVVLGGSPTLEVARAELERGLSGLLGVAPVTAAAPDTEGSIVLSTLAATPALAAQPFADALVLGGDEAFVVRRIELGGRHVIAIAGNTERGVLYGAYALLRHLARHAPLSELAIDAAPRVARRVLNHWDNLDRSVERGYAGSSLWDWKALPGGDLTRYVDYARANASLGINGSVLTNVNANAQVLTPAYLDRVRALADVFRPYGIAVYLTARFSAPIEIGGLRTADPLAPEVQAWWSAKADEIYALIPDFGGFLVKANSEGQPGPQEYGRTHADGANMLADAVAPHGGVVMWRAFVYSSEVPTDRIRQAYDEFEPLDASFRDNVLVQVKNGPLDFQPREPFHPLFGAMPETPLALELQITKEYLGQDSHLAYLGPLFEEVLDADTFAEGPGSTVARVIDGSLHDHRESAIAGVANIGTDRDWTGSHMNAANWYAYGRLAWDPGLSAAEIADEWIRQTFSSEPAVVAPVSEMLMSSREALVDYQTPLGLTHIMASHHHYGPGPWVNDLGRADWNPVYYHRADATGVGFDRTASGSNALEQYFPPVRDLYASRASVPDNLLLFFHRVGWNEPMRSGRSLWHELVARFDAGVAAARRLGTLWSNTRGWVDARRHGEVARLLRIQADEARWWRDAALAYFARVSGLPLPEGAEPPAHPLEFYQGLGCPEDRTKPRCPTIYTRGANDPAGAAGALGAAEAGASR